MIVETKKGDLPVRYGWNALAKFGDLAGLSMDEILELDIRRMSMSNMLNFIYVGFVEGARKEGVDCQVANAEEVGDMLDEEPGLAEKVFKAFAEMSKLEDVKTDSKKK
jgi:hypothetical protein